VTEVGLGRDGVETLGPLAAQAHTLVTGVPIPRLALPGLGFELGDLCHKAALIENPTQCVLADPGPLQGWSL
jgi:hypothetical protein